MSPPKVSATDQPYRYDEKSDFKGGLNLRADQFNIAENESPALLNVDVDPRGGVRRRDAVTKVNSTALDDDIVNLISHYEEGQNQVLAAVATATETKLLWNDDVTGDFDGTVSYGGTDVQFDTTQPPRGVTFNGYTYVVNGKFLTSTGHTTYSVVRWSGADGSTALATPDIDGSDGHFPNARYTTTWAEYIWVAYTLESGTTHKNRVRWSKVNVAENWTAADYIDIDIGEDGDHITAIIPDADRLLVFKENSIYAIYGFSSDSFEVRNITRTAGCRDGSQPVAATAGIFFWYAEEGIYLLSYDALAWAFERIKPAMTYDVGQPALTLGTAPSLMWFDERLWVSVDYQSDDNVSGSNQNNRRNVFVWDPSLTETGAWMRHDINARSLLAYRPTGDTHLGIAATSVITDVAEFNRISKLDQNADVDDYGAGSADEIVSYYQTGWFIGNRPTFPKRWGKTRTVLLADNNLRIYMYIYKDYDLSGWVSPAYYKDITGMDSPATWDTDPSGSGDGVWDTSEWQAAGTSDRYLFARWPTVGTAQAISLRFKVSPSVSLRGKWGVTSIIGMYRTRRLR
ncbi:MAG: hypothetical protein CL902_00275 [Dehalococcoidia bacterium]|nr:hypothetical protein [Dehalococcoidia bacterium]